MLAMAKFFANSQTREVKANYLQLFFNETPKFPGLSSERYHLKYNSDPTSSFCTLAWRNLPGFAATRPLA
jgi:hypothetical protein